jgi:hypothetical protein
LPGEHLHIRRRRAADGDYCTVIFAIMPSARCGVQ